MDLHALNDYYNGLEEYEHSLNMVRDYYDLFQLDTDTQQNVQNTVRRYVEEHLRKELEKGDALK